MEPAKKKRGVNAYALLVALIILSVGVGFTIGWFLKVEPEAEVTPAYVLGHISIINGATFTTYAGMAGPTIAAAGGSVQVAPGGITHLSSTAYGDSVDTLPFGVTTNPQKGVLIKFPSMEAAKGWYGSFEYQKAIPYRLAGGDVIFTLAELDAVTITSGTALVVVVGTIKDATKFSTYAGAAGPLVTKHGGSVLVPPTNRTTMTDLQMPFVAANGRRVFVCFQFPSATKATDWYADSEYQAIIPTRLEAMDAVISLMSA